MSHGGRGHGWAFVPTQHPPALAPLWTLVPQSLSRPELVEPGRAPCSSGTWSRTRPGPSGLRFPHPSPVLGNGPQPLPRHTPADARRCVLDRGARRTRSRRRPPSSTSPRRSGASAAWTGPCTSVRASPRASSAGRRGRPLSPAGRATARSRAAPSASSGDGQWAWRAGRASGRGQRRLARPRPWRERTGPTHGHRGRGASSPPGPGSCWARGQAERGRREGAALGGQGVHPHGAWGWPERGWPLVSKPQDLGEKRLPFQSCSDPVSEESGKEGAGSQAEGEAPN